MFALDPAALDDSADRIAAAAGVLSCLDVASPFGAVTDGLEGSAAAGGSQWAASRLDAAVDAWAAHLLDLCETARQVARDVAATDHDVAVQLRPVPR